MITVIATIHLHPGNREAFVKAFKENVPAVLAEDGCIQYEPVVDTDSGFDAQPPLRENAMTVVEKWASMDALKAHLAAPHMAIYRDVVKDMVANVELAIMEPA